jgi:hypothetical protein
VTPPGKCWRCPLGNLRTALAESWALEDEGPIASAIRSAAEKLGKSFPTARNAAVLRVRRRYAQDPAGRPRGDPWGYFHDVLGYSLLTQKQEEALELIERSDRVLLPSGNNQGKTWLLAGYGVYRMDAVAAFPDELLGLEEQGCQLLLPGPDHNTVFATIYSAMLEHAERAERRGFTMPGYRSEKSVLWRVRPRWQLEAFSPPARVGESVSHAASGRHHANQVALIEEGQGVEARVWTGVEGMCSGDGNKIVSSFNPTESTGPAYQRAQAGSYKVLHFSALEHPNVVERRTVIPGAVSYRVIDERVRDRDDCQDRGSFPETKVDPERHEFVYALPERDGQEPGPRSDGFPGAAGAQLRVYRPRPLFVSQVLGEWPKTSESGLIQPAAWDRAVARWLARRRMPKTAPDQIGADIATTGEDDTVTMPRWGPDAEELLRAYGEGQEQKDPAKAVAVLQQDHRRIVVGELVVHPKGDGPDTAQHIGRTWPQDSPVHFDERGEGKSAFDHYTKVMGRHGAGVSFGQAAPPPVLGEPWSENARTSMGVRVAMLINRDLIDVPPDPKLREEALVQKTLDRFRTVEERREGRTIKRRVPSVILVDKDQIKKDIGRSPDKWDTLCLAVNGSGIPKRKQVKVW